MFNFFIFYLRYLIFLNYLLKGGPFSSSIYKNIKEVYVYFSFFKIFSHTILSCNVNLHNRKNILHHFLFSCKILLIYNH